MQLFGCRRQAYGGGPAHDVTKCQERAANACGIVLNIAQLITKESLHWTGSGVWILIERTLFFVSTSTKSAIVSDITGATFNIEKRRVIYVLLKLIFLLHWKYFFCKCSLILNIRSITKICKRLKMHIQQTATCVHVFNWLNTNYSYIHI